jgi:hypothetical protein
MRSLIRLIFLIMFCAISCHRPDRVHESVMVVRMDPKESRPCDLDSLFAEYRLVPLETRAECLVGKLRGIQLLDDRILVLSNTSGDQELLLFDGSGKFISKTTKGKGPGEINSVQSFYVDNEDQSVWIANNTILQHYTHDGNYLGSEFSPVFNVVSMIRIKDAFYMTTLMGTVCCVSHDSLIWQMDSPKSENITGLISIPNLIKDKDDPLLFSDDFRTLYKIGPDTLVPKVVVDFGSSNLPVKGIVYNMRDPTILEMINSNGYVTGLSNFKYSGGDLSFTGYWKNRRLTFIHSEKAGTNRVMSGLDFGLLLNPFPTFASHDSKLVCSLAPDVLSGLYQEFKTNETSQVQLTARKRYPAIFEMLDTMDINANPVLLIGKLR